jgi:pimeloyl-ACP methyl ester carboxylesterase
LIAANPQSPNQQSIRNDAIRNRQFPIVRSAIVRSSVLDFGTGIPVVLIPGIQGRWEWMKPAADALAKRCRLITFSLGPVTSASSTIDEIDAALDQAKVDRAVICGVSLGGVVALRYALERPHRTRGIVLVSTPGPKWRANNRQAFFARHYAAASPLFALNAVMAMLPEVIRARGGWVRGLMYAARHGTRVLVHPTSPRRMKQRYDLWLAAKRNEEYRSIASPALIITGDRDLDRVVPVDGTLEYARLIRGARVERLENTGHIGLVTKPERFAEIVARFADAC